MQRYGLKGVDRRIGIDSTGKEGMKEGMYHQNDIQGSVRTAGEKALFFFSSKCLIHEEEEKKKEGACIFWDDSYEVC